MLCVKVGGGVNWRVPASLNCLFFSRALHLSPSLQSCLSLHLLWDSLRLLSLVRSRLLQSASADSPVDNFHHQKKDVHLLLSRRPLDRAHLHRATPGPIKPCTRSHCTNADLNSNECDDQSQREVLVHEHFPHIEECVTRTRICEKEPPQHGTHSVIHLNPFSFQAAQRTTAAVTYRTWLDTLVDTT